MQDRFDLRRFVEAQQDVIDDVRAELRSGRKTSHWMWFIFPQLKGLGSSSMANRYAISGRQEAVEYLAHPVLGPRLIECTELVNQVEGRSATQILGDVDALKFRSSLTLFAEVQPGASPFQRALDKYYGGQPDLRTQHLLQNPIANS